MIQPVTLKTLLFGGHLTDHKDAVLRPPTPGFSAPRRAVRPCLSTEAILIPGGAGAAAPSKVAKGWCCRVVLVMITYLLKVYPTQIEHRCPKCRRFLKGDRFLQTIIFGIYLKFFRVYLISIYNTIIIQGGPYQS